MNVDRSALKFFPEHVPGAERQSGWPIPQFLSGWSAEWAAQVCQLYTDPITFPASLSPEAGLLMYALVRNLRPRICIEVGSFLSVSTHWIAGALKENGQGVLHCFDDFSPIEAHHMRTGVMPHGRLEYFKKSINRGGIDSVVRIHAGKSWPELEAARPALVAEGGIDFAFLDGDHTKAGLVADFERVEPVLNTGGFVVLHDTIPERCGHDGPRHLLDNLDSIGKGTYEKCDLYISPLNYGLGVIRRLK